jgi:hypothetical protein
MWTFGLYYDEACQCITGKYLEIFTQPKYESCTEIYQQIHTEPISLDQGFSNFFGPRHTISLCEI